MLNTFLVVFVNVNFNYTWRLFDTPLGFFMATSVPWVISHACNG